MARKPQVQARVAEDTKAQIDQYQEQRGISQADAIRRLLRAGLEAETKRNKGLLERLASKTTIIIASFTMMTGGLLLILASTFATNGQIGLALATTALSTVTMLAATGTALTATLAQLALARPLRGLIGLNTEVEA